MTQKAVCSNLQLDRYSQRKESMTNPNNHKLSPELSVLFCKIIGRVEHLPVEQKSALRQHLRNILVAIDQASVSQPAKV